jgi:membrane-bound lytic murein transglycosylase D
VHDDRRLDVIYQRLDLPPADARQTRRELIDARKAYYADRLRRLATDRQARDAVDERILELWADAPADELRAAAERLRFQLGQADRFQAGLERAGAWRDWVRDVLASRDLPLELAALQHVESSWNPHAGSKMGAAGVWQFMHATARSFSPRVDPTIDERRDPLRSTEAAVAYLSDAYVRLGSWPLAVISYNHGVNGMARAKAQVGTDDVTRILREYQSPTFKFASRNFYPSFLAALEVDRRGAELFPSHVPHARWETCTIPLRKGASAADIARKFSIDTGRLKALNPAVADAVWAGSRKLPAGYAVRVPLGTAADPSMRSLMEWERARTEARPSPVLHTVSRGDTLAAIAARYRTTPQTIAALNGVSEPHRLRPGQTLTVTMEPGLCGTTDARAASG